MDGEAGGDDGGGGGALDGTHFAWTVRRAGMTAAAGRRRRRRASAREGRKLSLRGSSPKVSDTFIIYIYIYYAIQFLSYQCDIVVLHF